jgi:hypothetical protein
MRFLCEMEEFYVTVLFKIIYIAKRHVAFCLIAESYFIKVLVALLGQMDVSIKFGPVMQGHVGLLITNESSHHYWIPAVQNYLIQQ